MERFNFGTDGWRAILGDGFTVAAVKMVSQGLGNFLRKVDWPGEGVALGYDTRFLGERFARACAQVLAGNGIHVLWLHSPVPTPVLSYMVDHRKCLGGVMITASHNPPTFNGFKFKPWYAGSASGEVTAGIQAEANAVLERSTQLRLAVQECSDLSAAEAAGLLTRFDPRQVYFDRMQELVDFRRIASAGLKVACHLMHGTGAGYLDRLLAEAGCDVETIGAEPDPTFGGRHPDPIEPHIVPLEELVRATNADVGFATDGDADRLGVVDEKGQFVNSHLTLALLLVHLVENRGWRGPVARTVSTSSMIDRLAEMYGLPVRETPVGFKYICDLLRQGDLILGGEESGGFGFRGHIPERDGMLSALFFAEAMAVSDRRASEMVNELFSRIGPHFFGRIDRQVSPKVVERWNEDGVLGQPDSLAGVRVARIESRDGRKIVMEDASWLLLRPSGTEPVFRIYAEASDPGRVGRLLDEGQEILASVDHSVLEVR